MSPSSNCTYVTLIPKVKKPMSVNDFRPISLYNVLYKITSKVLANIIKKVLLAIISSTQSAFIPAQLITDNIIVAYEVLHTMKTRQSGSMALRLHMSKAYDKIEWLYLETIMKKMGFEKRWISFRGLMQ